MPRKRKSAIKETEEDNVVEVPRLLKQYFQEKEGKELTDQEILDRIRRK